MPDPFRLDDLTRRLAGVLPPDIARAGEDVRKNLRSALEAGLERMDLVTREEFDVQSAVLARTREKLETLEARLAELEAGGPPGPG